MDDLFTKDTYFQIAVKEYEKFKLNSPFYDESYKEKILSRTKLYLSSININKENVAEVIQFLISQNPQSGSFVHWSNLKDLHNFAIEKPEEVSLLLNQLYNSALPVDRRIDMFIEQGKQYNMKISLGTPLFGYLLAAYDYLSYPLYKDEIFRDFLITFEISGKYKSLGAKYKNYMKFCKLIINNIESWSMLNAQDFIYCLSQYYDLITNTAVKFLHNFARQLKEFKGNQSYFIKEIQTLDSTYLEALKIQYTNNEKVNKIRYEILNIILTKGAINIEDIEKLKNNINSHYETNILKSWTDFTILFPLYYTKFKNKVELELKKIHNAIQNIEELSDLDFTPDRVINGFTWRQHFGSTDCWLAVYPKNKTSHKVSAQLFLRIDEEKVEYGLYADTEMGIGSNINDMVSHSNIDQFSYENLKNKIVELISKYKDLNEKQPGILGESKQSYSEDVNYFWITAKPSIWTVDKIKDGSEVFYTAYNQKGNKRRIFTAFEKVKRGDKIVFYEATPRKEIVALGEVIEGLHKEKAEDYADGEVDGITLKYLEDVKPISWAKLVEVVELKDSNPMKNASQGSLFELTKDEFEIIMSLEELEEIPEIEEVKSQYIFPKINFTNDINIKQLHFDDKEIIMRQVKTALKNGKHIIFTGPPGTGKSKLAKEICNSLDVQYIMATATSDWSTFETIGGYRPTNEGDLLFKPGLFLDCIKDEATLESNLKWLIIDELNRADIDKAFGALFSALTGDPITLSFESPSGNNILLRPQTKNEESMPLNDYEYVIPRDWRIIGTMNTFDKASLYELSYAFMRRFAFIPITIPKNINEELVNNYLDVWGINNYEITAKLTNLWIVINKYRKIGPAIIKDIAEHIAEDDDMTSAIMMYVLPQFEGLQENEINQFVEEVKILVKVEEDRLIQFAGDFF